MGTTGTGEGSEVRGEVPRGRGRRHTRRRVVAPPTNPAADQGDEPPDPGRRDPDPGRRDREPGRSGVRTPDPDRLDPRDSWILEQRPPHWD